MLRGFFAAAAIGAAAFFTAGAAGAATVTFDTFTDTGSPSVDPKVTIEQIAAGVLKLTASIDSSSAYWGAVILATFDVGTKDVLSTQISNVRKGTSALAYNFYGYPSNPPNSANFNGHPLSTTGFDFALGFSQQDDVLAERPLSFTITQAGLTPEDFLKVGLRLQRVCAKSIYDNGCSGESSDKLISATPVAETPAVPLPASALLLLGGLGALGAARRRV